MNRIYQGKVTKVTNLPKGKDGQPEPNGADQEVARQKWQDALWQHHQLFQTETEEAPSSAISMLIASLSSAK